MSDLIERSEAVDLVRKMQTYKLSANADFLLVDQAEVISKLMAQRLTGDNVAMIVIKRSIANQLHIGMGGE